MDSDPFGASRLRMTHQAVAPQDDSRGRRASGWPAGGPYLEAKSNGPSSLGTSALCD